MGRAVVCALVLAHMCANLSPALAQTDRERPFVAMEFDNDDLHATRSLQVHGTQFTHLFPVWLHLTDTSGRVHDDVRPGTLRQARESGLTVIPVLDNFSGPNPVPDAVSVVLADPELRTAVVQDVVTELSTNDLDGVNVRFFGMGVEGYAAEYTFLEALRSALRPSGRVVIASVFVAGEAAIDPDNLAALSRVADYVHVLIYPEHEGDMVPGPAASRAFFRTELDKAVENVPSEKLIVGITLIGYDWSDESGDDESAVEIDFPRAMALAGARGGRIAWDGQSGALSLTYDEAGIHHRAYFDDALTTSNKLKMVEARGPAGVSFDRIGREDPTLWERLAGGGSPERLSRLSVIPADLPLQIIGDGEVWEVANGEQRAGRRRFTTDPVSGEATDIEYTALPSLRVIERAGGSPDSNLIALTFDDGPSREWTPRVLDLLGEYQVPATFFVVGQNALANPDLIRRILDEGHEIGNHTFTHSQVGDMSSLRTRLELNATRGIIAEITGRVPRYFRPPYDDNTHPFFAGESFEEGTFFFPIMRTHAYGYMTVGAALDPRDWEQPGVGNIVRLATDRQLDPPGHVIMLHDAGGDRLQTLQALPLIIEYYRSEGYEFTTVSGLLERNRDFGMPPVAAEQSLSVRFVAAGLQGIQTAAGGLRLLFHLAIALGVVRAAMLLPAALAQARQRHRSRHTTSSWQPWVSVLVPAYNEARVIGKSLEALLQSHYEKLEIIVIDDGSTDGTAQVVDQYMHDPRVRIVVREHEGKSSALNAGIQQARGEIVVTTDADTLLAPDFIPQVLAEFEDPRVAAVSGNVKVGNRHCLLASWQSIEYITAYNLDRRAYALLNCISVVPGAGSAWRRRDLLRVGGFAHDTLAEDADLTVKLRRLGLRVGYADRALAWTESPRSIRDFLKQRRRWSYGTLQVLWKHRDVFFRPKYGALGFVAFPSALIYLGLVLLAPLMEGSIVWALVQLSNSLVWHRSEMPPVLDSPLGPLIFCLPLIGVEWSLSLSGFLLDGESKWPLLWVPIQRLTMRWLLYYAMFRSVFDAIRGIHVSWNKVERTGTVRAGPEPTTLSLAPGRVGVMATPDTVV